ncbi:MAG TPA: phage integrase N-terminal SAM-like domain-containing protein [Nitrospiria bacterium]
MRYWWGFQAVLPNTRYQRSQGAITQTYMPDATRSQQPKLLDEVRKVLRLHHYSIHTERSYVDWIVRFVRFHCMRSREDQGAKIPPPRRISAPRLE